LCVHISEIKGINPLELFDPSDFLSFAGVCVLVKGARSENYIYKGAGTLEMGSLCLGQHTSWIWNFSQVFCSLNLVGSRFPLGSHFSTLCSLWNKKRTRISLKEVSAGDINFLLKEIERWNESRKS